MADALPRYTVSPGFEGVSGGCPCCGGGEGRVFGFAYRDGAPFAVYQAGEAGLSGSGEVVIAVTIGPFDRSSGPADRLTVSFTRPCGEGETLFGPQAREVPGWPEVEAQGIRLRPDEAQRHPALADFRAVAEAALAGDGRLSGGPWPSGTMGRRFTAGAPAAIR